MLKLKLWLVSTLVFVLMIAATIWIGKTYGQTISFVADQLYSERGSVDIFDLWTRRRIRIIEDVSSYTYNTSWSPDLRLFGVQSGWGSESVFALYGAISDERVSNYIDGELVRWLPDSRALVYRFSNQYFRYNLNSKESTLILTLPEGVEWVLWSADLRQIAFVQTTTDQPSQIMIADVSMQSIRSVGMGHFSYIDWMNWSPDGRWIAVMGGEHFYLLDTSGQVSPQLMLETPEGRIAGFEWSPDSRSLLFACCSDGQNDLFLATTGTNVEIQQLTYDGQISFDGFMARWSPDGSTVVIAEWNWLSQVNLQTRRVELLPATLNEFGRVTFLP